MKIQIKHIFDRQALLTDEEWLLFSSKLIERQYQKGDLILKQGAIENYLTFIIQGTARMFTFDSEMNEYSVSFSSENSFCSSYSSFISQTPSLVSVEALEPILAYQISYAHLQELYSISHTGERLGRINAELYLAFKEEREIMLLTMSAKEKYLNLIEKYPKLLNLVKLEHIATYLGITPQSLSRIRNSIRNS
ncbi:MAG: Crp/Fnr family transcriptional regulator [Bacteroidia bacterium]|nr:Crp/Fnr family transcriptional regulator [Bacteroidia bacterium]